MMWCDVKIYPIPSTVGKKELLPCIFNHKEFADGEKVDELDNHLMCDAPGHVDLRILCHCQGGYVGSPAQIVCKYPW